MATWHVVVCECVRGVIGQRLECGVQCRGGGVLCTVLLVVPKLLNHLHSTSSMVAARNLRVCAYD